MLERGQVRGAFEMYWSGVEPTPSPVQVLVVEDDPTTRDVALLILDRLGYQADAAANGIEALAAAHGRLYDVILMDLHLPEMDGMEATRRIRSELPSSCQPTVIAMSANVSTDVQILCLLTGIDDYLNKPIRIRDLAVALEAWGTRYDPAAQLAHSAQPVPEIFGAGMSTSLSVAPSAPLVPVSPVEGPLVYDPGPLDALVSDLGPEGGPVRREIIETFLDGAADRVVAIGLAAHDDDGRALAFSAHAMRSSSAALGLLALSEAAGRIESAFRDTPEGMDVAFEAVSLVAHHNRATAALRVVLETQAGKEL